MPALLIEDFGPADALGRLPPSRQLGYLRCYFAGAGAQSVLEEPEYFDRDYLSEFQAFYSTSARGYTNLCRRVHFFARRLTRDELVSAASDEPGARDVLQRDYLGFVVIRPIKAAPLGRVVARWYPDAQPNTPRIVTPARDYVCHVAGVPLNVYGLAWQQQDSAVGACATVALWTLLHSSAFDDAHAIPTTADITRFAHRTASLGARVFPSQGLSPGQMLEAIKEAGLAPLVLAGDKTKDGKSYFSRERFASSCASLIRSGYPVILAGEIRGHGGHAICAVGFREAAAVIPGTGRYEFHDARVERLYVNDDNIGPNARFTITAPAPDNYVVLERAAPKPAAHPYPDPTYPHPAFIPQFIVAAVHEGLRTSPDALHREALKAASVLASAIAQQPPPQGHGITLTTRLMKLPAYYRELGERLVGARAALGRARLGLAEQAPPMSLHVGVVRLAEGSSPHVDVLYDTTDSDRNLHAFCHVLYSAGAANFATALHAQKLVDWGTPIAAY